jgi:cholesterol transport system auxiliary component
MRTAPLLAVAALALVLAGCSGVLPGSNEPARMYTLTPKSTFSPDLPRATWQLTIDRPISEAGLDTMRIALRHSPVTLEYFARAEWVDKAPIIVQKLLVESFEATGKIVAVARQSVSLRSDYNLLCELREFQAEYEGNGPPSVRVRLNVKLVKMPERIIVGSYSAEFVEKSTSIELERIVEAWDVALGKALKRVVEWTLVTGAEVQATFPKD